METRPVKFKVGDWVRIIAQGQTGLCGKVLLSEINEFNEPIIIVKTRISPEGYRKYPYNIVPITEEEAMIYLLEDS